MALLMVNMVPPIPKKIIPKITKVIMLLLSVAVGLHEESLYYLKFEAWSFPIFSTVRALSSASACSTAFILNTNITN